ncbi:MULTISPECIES: hypothetical protein [Undibacterium]|jgi:hypothetical protein|uniref:Uncharacterized protein n=1 Tax=Undibacterium aquatile TaxID=1537398 RepID=A0ABR6XD12_9BURK|nr:MULTISPECIES: hypothetical protein [Undibacterium]MBC3810782.1 hypothetical protein [Undibacterium aquatile]MBC3878994.1 hypothetical protein [Undibacterium sp. FT79W]MBC3928258.1 hypothetical protein [Undibacterium sp. CY21W]
MWKILVGFIIFAAAALFLIFKAGDKVDMQGEAAGHNPTEVHSASASAEATTPAPVAAPAPASDAAASSK